MLLRTHVHDLLEQMDELRRHVDQSLQWKSSGTGDKSFPDVNIFKTDNQVLLTAPLPGVDPATIELTAYRDTITLKGVREDYSFSEKDEVQVEWNRRERQLGAFTRTIRLPYEVDESQVQARARNGILAVAINRPDSDKPKRIRVEVSEN